MNCAKNFPPDRHAALDRIAGVRPASYAQSRNHIDGAVTGLSPYLTHGLVTLHEVLAGVLQKEPLSVDHKLVFELGWREFFRHVWSHMGDGIFQSLHAGPLPEEAYALELPVDIRQACTGVRVIDEAVRSLYATGILHNHARMWLASYIVHMRKVHWRTGADWMVSHLLDGDLASNHLSWQWVAGTGSHKPYLFNADNVKRFAPAPWHSPGSVIDRSYEELDAIARSATSFASTNARYAAEGITHEPTLHATPPPELHLRAPNAETTASLKNRDVWLVHPWALRQPPVDLPKDAAIIGVYLSEYHEIRPWSAARWQWVDTAMSAVTQQRWTVNSAILSSALVGAARVRSIDDPHIKQWLQPLAQLDPAPALFPQVPRQCTSFSKWWTNATRRLSQAEDLLSK